MTTTLFSLTTTIQIALSDDSVLYYAKQKKLSYKEAYKKLCKIHLLTAFAEQLELRL